MSDFDGKTALVTGASKGIGRAIAQMLGRSGAYVGINYRSDENGARGTADEIKNAGGECELLQFDVTDSAAVKSSIKDFAKERGRLDILVANAGITIDNMTAFLTEEDFDKVYRTNTLGAFSCAKACIKPMLKTGAGRIIFVSSIVGFRGNAGQAAYSASKAALLGLTKSLAKELAPRNILVNAVAPGYIETSMTEAMADVSRKVALAMIPLGKSGKPEQVALLVKFLAGSGADYITGQVIPVDGGMSI